MLFKIILLVVAAVVVCGVLYFIKREKDNPNGPTPLPILNRDRRSGIHTPENRKKLMDWNEKNFRCNPSFIYPGPEGEDWQVREYRQSLFTPEQLTAVPLMRRVMMRSKRTYSPDKRSCRVCGKGQSVKSFDYNMHWQGVDMCQDCYTRYQKDKAGGWAAPKDFSEAAEAMLWMLQQHIAMNLIDNAITKTTAKAEMQEAVDVIRQDMYEANARDESFKSYRRQDKSEQEELSHILHDLNK